MDYSQVSEYIGQTVRMRYNVVITNYTKTLNEFKQEVYKEIRKKVINKVTGIVTACTSQSCFFLILDDLEDNEIPIKLTNIRSIKSCKIK